MSPLLSLFITGTDTGVGKTVVTAMLLKKYREAGVDAFPFKPVASGAVRLNGHQAWADETFLSVAADVDGQDAGLYRFEKPLSPHLASAAEGVAIDVAAIVDKFHALEEEHGAVLVEGAGGIMAPVNGEATFLDIAAALELPVVVVASSRLGTLNHTALTIDALRSRGLAVAGLVVNRFPQEPGEAERPNPGELEKLTGVPLLGVVPDIDVAVEELKQGDIDSHLDCIDLSLLDGGGRVPGETHTGGRAVTRSRSQSHDYSEAIEADRDHVWHPFSPMLEYLSEKPHPLMIVGAEGSRLIDSDGRSYIDGTASLWVNVHGHRRPELDRAVNEQLGRVAHTTLLGLANEPSALLARELAALAPPGLSRVFYSDNGSTAVEVALKVAFQYWQQSGHPEKQEFISFTNAYHGDTIGAVSVGGHDLFHSMFSPLLFKAHLAPAPYCYRCPVGMNYPDCGLGCLEGFRELLDRRAGSVAALIIEPRVQGAAGILVQPPGFLKEVAHLCRQHGVLLIADEVATGFGRTGTLFACEQENVEPDIMALAKGLTGGYLPLAATLFKEEIYEAFLGRYEELKTFFHGHTYTGNPLACAVALANAALVKEPEFLDGVRERARLLAELLEPVKGMRHVGDIRQLGLMAGIELVADSGSREPYPVEERVARRVILKARERGVVIRPLGDTVVLMPPLAIGEGDLKELVGATAWAIAEITG